MTTNVPLMTILGGKLHDSPVEPRTGMCPLESPKSTANGMDFSGLERSR